MGQFKSTEYCLMNYIHYADGIYTLFKKLKTGKVLGVVIWSSATLLLYKPSECGH